MEQIKSEVLNRVDKYLSLMRYEYSTQEKLSRLKVLKDYYSTMEQLSTPECLVSNMECAEQLSTKLTLPLKTRGVFLKPGRHKVKFYPKDEIEKSVDNPINAQFPLMLDHKDNEASMVIGMVDEIWYDESISGLRWKGHINDETTARNVIDRAVKEVSATIFSTADHDPILGIVGRDLVFKELSIVMDGAVVGNFIEEDK